MRGGDGAAQRSLVGGVFWVVCVLVKPDGETAWQCWKWYQFSAHVSPYPVPYLSPQIFHEGGWCYRYARVASSYDR